MESYIVRVYRRNDSDPNYLTGMVESVQDGRRQRFSTMQQLWRIVAARGAKHTPVVKEHQPED
ncbi:MAG: hypothetical protein M3294_07830 [Pseudomonadota bacterium]|nr:hypothetical protein [Pseudomonadota bacterium]